MRKVGFKRLKKELMPLNIEVEYPNEYLHIPWGHLRSVLRDMGVIPDFKEDE
jgi:hypothetical protein